MKSQITELQARLGALQGEILLRHLGTSTSRKTARLLSLEEGSGRYRSIYADPGWSYTDRTCRGSAARHYTLTALDEVCRLPVRQLAHPEGCYLWLWIPWPKLRDGFAHRVLEAWAFQWKSEVVWNKVKIGQGRWLRKQTEILILAARGRVCRPRAWAHIRDLVTFARGTEHSEKPDYFRRLIASACPGPMIELFARTNSPYFDRWGDEAPDESAEQPPPGTARDCQRVIESICQVPTTKLRAELA